MISKTALHLRNRFPEKEFLGLIVRLCFLKENLAGISVPLVPLVHAARLSFF